MDILSWIFVYQSHYPRTCSGCDHLVLYVFFLATRLALFWTLLAVVLSLMKDHAILDVCFALPISNHARLEDRTWTTNAAPVNDTCHQSSTPKPTWILNHRSYHGKNLQHRSTYVALSAYSTFPYIDIHKGRHARQLQRKVDEVRPLDPQPTEWNPWICKDNLTDISSCSSAAGL
jgi:hypothetical protein